MILTTVVGDWYVIKLLQLSLVSFPDTVEHLKQSGVTNMLKQHYYIPLEYVCFMTGYLGLTVYRIITCITFYSHTQQKNTTAMIIRCHA